MSTLEERKRLVEEHRQLIADTQKKLEERKERFLAPLQAAGATPEDFQRFLNGDRVSPVVREHVERAIARDQAEVAERQRQAKEALHAEQRGRHSPKHRHDMV